MLVQTREIANEPQKIRYFFVNCNIEKKTLQKGQEILRQLTMLHMTLGDKTSQDNMLVLTKIQPIIKGYPAPRTKKK